VNQSQDTWLNCQTDHLITVFDLPPADNSSYTSRQILNYGYRLFEISGPRIWNSLPDYLKDSELSKDIFKRYLKTYFSLAINYSTL